MPESNRLEVGLFDLGACDPGRLDACRQYLDAEELARLGRFRNENSARQFLVGRALLRRMLSEQSGIAAPAWRFRAAPKGRPFVSAPDRGLAWRFSISHTAGIVACCLRASAEIGVDVEATPANLDIDRLAASVFHPTEAARLRALPAGDVPAAFLQLWTLKEAYLKATGEGLHIPLKSFYFELEAGIPRLRLSTGETTSAWHFTTQPIGQAHILAVALPDSPSPAPEVFPRWVSPDWLLREAQATGRLVPGASANSIAS